MKPKYIKAMNKKVVINNGEVILLFSIKNGCTYPRLYYRRNYKEILGEEKRKILLGVSKYKQYQDIQKMYPPMGK